MHGLVFRSFMYLFQLLQEKPDAHFVLKASFLEIYNEKVPKYNQNTKQVWNQLELLFIMTLQNNFALIVNNAE